MPWAEVIFRPAYPVHAESTPAEKGIDFECAPSGKVSLTTLPHIIWKHHMKEFCT